MFDVMHFNYSVRCTVLILAIIFRVANLICFQGVAWPLLAVGYGVFGFGFVLASDIALSYAMDCYQNVIT